MSNAYTTEIELSAGEVQLYVELLELEIVYQLTQIYRTAKPETLTADMTRVLGIIRGYRSLDDYLYALQVQYFNNTPGPIKVKLDVEVVQMAYNCLTMTASELVMTPKCLELFRIFGQNLTKKVTEVISSWNLKKPNQQPPEFLAPAEAVNQTANNQDTSNNTVGLATNIFASKATA